MFEREPEVLHAFTEHLGRLKHDLGKYICFRQRWLPEDADAAALREAVRADVLGTRSGPSGTIDAVQVWNDFRGSLSGEVPIAGHRLDVREDGDGRVLFEAMGRIAAGLDDLRSDVASLDIEALAIDCRAVSDAVRALHSRARCASVAG